MKLSHLKWIAVAATALIGVSAVAAQEATTTPTNTAGATRTITVSGLGSAWGEPDVAYVDLGVETVDANLSAAFSAANDQMNALIEAIVAFGIDRQDIQTTTLTVYQEDIYDPNTGQPTGELRYHVQNFVRVTVRDTARIGEFVGMAVESGANRLLNLSFSILEMTDLEQEARTSAVEDARTRAQQLASLMGMAVGDPVSVRETTNNYAIPLGMGGGGVRMDTMNAAPVQGGQLQVDVQIEVTFELVSQ